MSCGPTAVVQRPLITSYFVNGNKGKKKKVTKEQGRAKKEIHFLYVFICFLLS